MMLNFPRRTTMRHQQGGILKIFAIYMVVSLVVLFGLIHVANRSLSPLEGLGKGFFVAIKDEQYDIAYDLCSTAFKQRVPRETFQNFLVQTRFIEVQNSQWHSPQIEGNKGTIMGTVTLKSGQTLPIQIWAIQEKIGVYPGIGDLSKYPIVNRLEVWKIYSFQQAKATPIN